MTRSPVTALQMARDGPRGGVCSQVGTAGLAEAVDVSSREDTSEITVGKASNGYPLRRSPFKVVPHPMDIKQRDELHSSTWTWP